MKITIITVCFNDCDGILRTINSIRSQTYTNYEVIIQDGGSTDGSVEVGNQFQREMPEKVIFNSEKDGGVFYGMNNATAKASGDYCIFMNSGDWFFDEYVLQNFVESSPTADILTGIAATHKNKKVQAWYPYQKNAVSLVSFWTCGSLSHQSSFIRTSLMKEMKYDTKFRIGADTKFFMEALLIRNATYQPLYFFVSHFMCDGMSSDSTKAADERNAILVDLFGKGIIKKVEQMVDNDWESTISQIDPNSKFGKIVSLIIRVMVNFRKTVIKIKR